MIQQETGPCALGIDTATLSALRDEALGSAEQQHLRDHIVTCPACQARLAGFEQIAHALRRQPELEPGDRIWRGVQARVAHPARRNLGRVHMRPAFSVSPSTWRGLAAVASIMLVVGLLAAVLASGARTRSETGPKPTQPVATSPAKPTFAPTTTPAFPTPTLPPTSPAITAQQAWGANAPVATLNTQLDATHYFQASGISLDGKSLYGVDATPEPGALPQGSAGILDLATHHFTPLGLPQTVAEAIHCCTTDGRYLLVVYDTAPGATCGLCHLTYYSYDLNTKTLWQIAKGTDDGEVMQVMLSHGLVLLGTGGQGIQVADLATQHISPLQVPVSGALEVDLLAYTWPYVVYTYSVPGPNGAPSPGHVRMHDLSTNQDIVLPQLDTAAADGIGAGVIDGQTMFLTRNIRIDPRANTSETSLYEDDTFVTSTTAPRLLATYADDLWVSAANDRLVIVGGGIVWDRTEQRFVALIPGASSSGPQVSTALSGHFLAVIQPVDQTGNSLAQQVTIYDTDALRTTPSA